MIAPAFETTTHSQILEEAVPPHGTVDVSVPGLRHGDITEGTGVVSVGGFVQNEVELIVDYQSELVSVQNLGVNPWAQGANLVISWEGVPLEAVVTDHETRIIALEAGAGTGGGTDPALEARVTALEAEDVKIWEQFQASADIYGTDFGVVNDRLNTHDFQLQGHEGRIVNVTNQSNNNAANIISVSQRTQTLETENSEQDAAIGNLDERVATLEAEPPTGGEGTGGGLPLTGGTLTGPLVLQGSDADSFALVIDTANPADGCSIQGRSAGVAKWEISLGGPDVNADFAISRYPTWESEFPQDSPLVITRAGGFIKLIIPECADSPAAAAAGVPIGGLYQTNANVKIRTY